MDDSFTIPRRVATLDEVEPLLHECYQPAADGDGFQLNPSLADDVARMERDLARTIDGYVTRAAMITAEIAEKDRLIARLQVEQAITRALRAAGVAGQFMRAATASIRAGHAGNFEVDADGTVSINDPAGKVPIEWAVSAWLSSEDGQPFAPRPAPQPGGGEVAARIAELRRTMH